MGGFPRRILLEIPRLRVGVDCGEDYEIGVVGRPYVVWRRVDLGEQEHNREEDVCGEGPVNPVPTKYESGGRVTFVRVWVL